VKSYVAYLRISSQSGLGLEAQRAAVAAFTSAAQVVREYVEVESGKKNERPQLQGAIALAGPALSFRSVQRGGREQEDAAVTQESSNPH
jgi:DNA invertase Pin-like site-specific DNA recombinase